MEATPCDTFSTVGGMVQEEGLSSVGGHSLSMQGKSPMS